MIVAFHYQQIEKSFLKQLTKIYHHNLLILSKHTHNEQIQNFNNIILQNLKRKREKSSYKNFIISKLSILGI